MRLRSRTMVPFRVKAARPERSPSRFALYIARRIRNNIFSLFPFFLFSRPVFCVFRPVVYIILSTYVYCTHTHTHIGIAFLSCCCLFWLYVSLPSQRQKVNDHDRTININRDRIFAFTKTFDEDFIKYWHFFSIAWNFIYFFLFVCFPCCRRRLYILFQIHFVCDNNNTVTMWTPTTLPPFCCVIFLFKKKWVKRRRLWLEWKGRSSSLVRELQHCYNESPAIPNGKDQLAIYFFRSFRDFCGCVYKYS